MIDTLINASLGATIAITVLLILSPELRENIVAQCEDWMFQAKRIFVKAEAEPQLGSTTLTQLYGAMGLPPSIMQNMFLAPAHSEIRHAEFDKEINDRIYEAYADKRLSVSYSRDKPDMIRIYDAAAPYDREITNVPYDEFFEKVYGDDAQMESVLFKMRYG